LIEKATCAVRHHALALRAADGLAQIGLRMKAIFAFAAFRRVERNDMIAGGDTGHAGANLAHNTGTLMAEDRREHPLGISA
jgi:hypothetical protein